MLGAGPAARRPGEAFGDSGPSRGDSKPLGWAGCCFGKLRFCGFQKSAGRRCPRVVRAAQLVGRALCPRLQGQRWQESNPVPGPLRSSGGFPDVLSPASLSARLCRVSVAPHAALSHAIPVGPQPLLGGTSIGSFSCPVPLTPHLCLFFFPRSRRACSCDSNTRLLP